MTIYNEIVWVVGGALLLAGFVWLVYYKLDKWLGIKEQQARIRALAEDTRKRLKGV